jgi:hypothetical protein
LILHRASKVTAEFAIPVHAQEESENAHHYRRQEQRFFAFFIHIPE